MPEKLWPLPRGLTLSRGRAEGQPGPGGVAQGRLHVLDAGSADNDRRLSAGVAPVEQQRAAGRLVAGLAGGGDGAADRGAKGLDAHGGNPRVK